MERDDYLAGGGDPYVEEHPEDWPPEESTAPREVGLLDVLLPRRRRALERKLQAEHNTRVYTERLAARRLRETHQWRGELWQAQRQIRGMTRDLDDAQEAEERLTEELFEAYDELAAVRQALADPIRALEDAEVTPLGRVYYVAAALQAMAERHGADSQFAHLWHQLQVRAHRVDVSGHTPIEGAHLVDLDPAEDVA